jgi:MoaA/NifB/PqqE/SkfB family radical SAM enzyme
MNVIERLRSVWHAVIPESLRAKIFKARFWGRVLFNYSLMRSRIANAIRPVGCWPVNLYIEGTNICNAKCAFCAYPQMERPKVKGMPMELFKSVVDQYYARGQYEVDLTPIVGDPFVDQLLFERLDYLHSLPKIRYFHFYTNAILMTPEKAERLMKYGARFEVFCSFGGFDRQTYRVMMGVDKFEEAVSAIRNLIETKLRTSSRIRIHVSLRTPKGNEKGEFWEYLKGKRAEGTIQMDSIDDYDNWGGMISDEALRAVNLVPKPPPVHRGPCHRLVTSPVVLADGRVNACACRDVEATLIIGDLKTQSLEEILTGPKLKELLGRHEREDFPEICKTCTRYESLYPAWMRGRLWKFAQALIGGR